jgi:hypothetical protein
MSDTYENLAGRVETYYSINRSTGYTSGIIQTSVGGGKNKATKFIRVESPTEVEIIKWTATSEKGPPTVPDPYGKDLTTGLNANLILLRSSIENVIPVEIGGGTRGHAWSVSGTYIYGAVKAKPIVRKYPLGKYPFDSDVKNVDSNYVPGSSFSKEIIDPTVPEDEILLEAPVASPGLFP